MDKSEGGHVFNFFQKLGGNDVWAICDISCFCFFCLAKVKNIIEKSPKTQLESCLIDIKLEEKPYFKGLRPGPALRISNFLPNFNFAGQTSYICWTKRDLFVRCLLMGACLLGGCCLLGGEAK